MGGVTLRPVEEIDVAVRAWAAPDYLSRQQEATSATAREMRVDPGPSAWSLVFDTETTTDLSQRLRIGAWQTRKAGRLRDEGLFYDPEVITPSELATLEQYARKHELRVLSREQFVEQVFIRVARDLRGLVVGHNLPFDLARLAIDDSPPQSRDKSMRGGFSFQLSDDAKQSRVQIKRISAGAAFMRLTIPAGASPERRNRRRGGKSRDHHGYFADTATLGGALLGGRPSLEGLAKTLQTEAQKAREDHGEALTEQYLDYCRNDVQVTWKCWQRLRERYASFRLSTPPWAIYSEASVGKAHLRQMGLTPWTKTESDFPDWLIAALLESYYGGRAETAIRLTPVPGVSVDFLSQYPTSFSLMGLWPFVTAEQIRWRELDPSHVQALLDDLGPDDVLDPLLWPRLPVLVCVAPDGDRLPTRARYRAGRRRPGKQRNRAYNVGIPYRTGGAPQHYLLADCVSSVLLTGKPPQVLAAWSFDPVGIQDNLQPIDVGGDERYRIDPRSDDFIRRLVELRAHAKADLKAAKAVGDGDRERWLRAVQQAMKITANASAYGSAIEMNPTEHRKPVWVTLHDPDSTRYRTTVLRSEEPGSWFHPLVAALVAAAGRLLLATAMRLVADQGGHYAFCDTDSLFVVATETGGLVPCEGGVHRDEQGHAAIRALSWQQVHSLAERFAALNPYDPTVVPGSILNVEDENYDPTTGQQRQIECFAIAAKRYALFIRTADGRPEIIGDAARMRRSAHGLGHLLPPYARKPGLDDRRWIQEWWNHLLHTELGFPHKPPPWFGEPAVGETHVSSQRDKAAFGHYNGSRPYQEQVRFGNFLLLAQPATTERGRKPRIRTLIAPFEREPEKRRQLAWTERAVAASRSWRIRVRGGITNTEEEILVLTYGDYFEEYRKHPEAKANGPDGKRCHPWTRGLLQPRHITPAGQLIRVGKESNRLSETAEPTEDDEENVIEYPARTCQACGKALQGRQRRWCSEACRKRERDKRCRRASSKEEAREQAVRTAAETLLSLAPNANGSAAERDRALKEARETLLLVAGTKKDRDAATRAT